jgi:transposase
VREIRERGYTGSQSIVTTYITKLRLLRGGVELGGNRIRNRPYAAISLKKLPTVYQISWWVILDRAKLKEDIDKLTQLCAVQPQLAKTYELVQDFNDLLRQRQAGGLNEWLDKMVGSEVPELVSVGRGMRQDEAAVAAGLTLPWSQGVVEETINKLKMVKRTMYGRAGLSLLTKRLLAA